MISYFLFPFWFCSHPRLLGLNINKGREVRIRLRAFNNDLAFLPFEQVLDTMLHELCHIEIGPHNAEFYRLWDELRKVLFVCIWRVTCSFSSFDWLVWLCCFSFLSSYQKLIFPIWIGGVDYCLWKGCKCDMLMIFIKFSEKRENYLFNFVCRR